MVVLDPSGGLPPRLGVGLVILGDFSPPSRLSVSACSFLGRFPFFLSVSLRCFSWFSVCCFE